MSPAAIVRTRFAASGLLAAVLTGMPLRAQETRYVKEGDVLVHTISGVLPGVPPKLSLQTDLGSVRIAGGAGSALRYRITVRAEGPGDARARRDLDAMAISVAKGGARVLFKGQLLEPDPELSAEFELTVPRDLQEIDVATGAGDVDLRGLAGRASIT